MGKYSFIIILLSFTSLMTNAQQDPDFSQTRSVLTFFNPAAAGRNDKICLNAVHREQWVGFNGGPSQSFFSADGAFSFFGLDHGVGLSIVNDIYGFNTDLGISLDYAYRMDLGEGILAMGLNLGIINKALDPEWNIPEDLGNVQGDDQIPQNKESRVAFDMGLGIFYNTEKLFFGISTTHLNQARISYENASPYLVRHYYLTAGYNLQLANPLFEVMPTFLLKSDGKANQIYLNTNVRYNKRFWGGVSYRGGSAIVGILGVELFNGVQVGYSYDFSTTKIGKYSSGSHELTLGYCFDLSLDRTPQKYKSIRFL
ncbi:MAG: type IX secretion system membrane protein PorP/SprF [Bacteroidota bacterium]